MLNVYLNICVLLISSLGVDDAREDDARFGTRGRSLLQNMTDEEIISMRSSGCDPSRGTGACGPSFQGECVDDLPSNTALECSDYVRLDLCRQIDEEFCKVSCDRCPEVCEDVLVPLTKDCTKIIDGNKCDDPEIKGVYCQKSCGQCQSNKALSSPLPPLSSPNPPLPPPPNPSAPLPSTVSTGQFSAQVSVTSVATAAPIALNLVDVDVSGAARLILELMANGSYADAVSQMSKVLLDGGTDQIKEVLTTSVDQGLNQSFIQVMSRIYQNSSFPILPFSISLGTAFGEVENQGAFVDLLGQVFTIVNQSGDYPNLREALYYAFTSQGGNIRAAYDQSLSSAIEESGCSSVAQVLAAGKDRADQLGLETLFMIAIQNNPDINECLQEELQQGPG